MSEAGFREITLHTELIEYFYFHWVASVKCSMARNSKNLYTTLQRRASPHPPVCLQLPFNIYIYLWDSEYLPFYLVTLSSANYYETRSS